MDKARIVRIHWEQWDTKTDSPEEVPLTAAPEDYILSRPHDPIVASELGNLWELVTSIHGHGRREVVTRKPRTYRTTVSITSERDEDFLRVDGLRSLLISSRAKDWLAHRFPEHLLFDNVDIIGIPDE